MPTFKVTISEEITREMVAYIKAPSKEAADQWASNASPAVFRVVNDHTDPWGEIEDIEAVDSVPDGWPVTAIS